MEDPVEEQFQAKGTGGKKNNVDKYQEGAERDAKQRIEVKDELKGKGRRVEDKQSK